MWNFQKQQQRPRSQYEAKSVHKTGVSRFTGGPIAMKFSIHADSCSELSSSASVVGKSATPCVAGDAGAGPGHETMVSSKLGQIS